MHTFQCSLQPPPVLFALPETTSGADTIFLGREWIFKELHQMAIAEQNTITLIRGAGGTGTSAILKQLALHSPFYSAGADDSNGSTVDSGIVLASTALSDLSVSGGHFCKTLGQSLV